MEETSPEWTPGELAKLHQDLPPMFGVFYPARESQTSMLELLEQAAPGLSVKSNSPTACPRSSTNSRS